MNKILRKIFGPKRDELSGEWIKLHNVELHNLYGNAGIIRMLKSRKLQWAVHVRGWEMEEGHISFLQENRRGSVHLLGRKLGGKMT